VRPRRRETDGESLDSLQAAVRARLPDRRNRFRDRPAVRSGYQKGKNTLVILMKGQKRKGPYHERGSPAGFITRVALHQISW
jgi:hypothetical protein